MKRRAFIQTGSAVLGGSLLSPLISCKEEKMAMIEEARSNWAGNLTYAAQDFQEPQSLEVLQKLIMEEMPSKGLGTCHSFNTVADTKNRQISLLKMPKIMQLDTTANEVEVSAGISYGELAKYLFEQEYALHNLASLPHISVAGACSTGTHGSGDKNGNLSSIVRELSFINGLGEEVVLTKGKDADFEGAVVSLGALGIIHKMKLEVLPHFDVRQDIYLDLPVEQIPDHFDEIFGMAYSTSMFTDWMNGTVNQIWLKRLVEDEGEMKAEAELFGAKLADRDVHPIIELTAENCTRQMGIAGPWHERLPHFKMDFTPSSGDELQSEFFVPRKHAVEALMTIYEMGEEIYPHLFISEIRSIAADDLWISPFYQEDRLAIHFTWKPHGPEVMKLIPIIEEKLKPFNVRPHWGKLFTVDESYLSSSYSEMERFRSLIEKHDPQRKFSNAFLERNIYAGEV
ncbi:MAG: D-arabinono-1,4-lactone oxidase [Bacteroidota bacterium]